MSTRPILSCQLKNGLSLMCLDKSKKITADRWYICIWVQVSIPVEKKWFGNIPVDEEKFQRIVSVLDKIVIFTQKRDRNFVSDDQKEQIVKSICDRATEMGMKYIGNDDFPAKYILKVFADQQCHR